MQDCINSSANALELPQSCTKVQTILRLRYWCTYSKVASQITATELFVTSGYSLFRPKTMKPPRLCIVGPLWRESTGEWWIPSHRWNLLTKGQWMAEMLKVFPCHGVHMMSLWWLLKRLLSTWCWLDWDVVWHESYLQYIYIHIHTP